MKSLVMRTWLQKKWSQMDVVMKSWSQMDVVQKNWLQMDVVAKRLVANNFPMKIAGEFLAT